MRLARRCAVLWAVTLWPISAFAGDSAAAREQLKIGYTLAEAGKCDEAIPHLAESLRLDPRAITLINLADCEEKSGKLATALSHWVDARSRAQLESAKKIEDEAVARATALEARIPRLTIVLAPGAPKEAVVERDGIVLGSPSLGIPLPLDPGPHTIVVKTRGRAEAAFPLTLAEGESQRVEVDAGPAERAAALAILPGPAIEKSGPRPLAYIGFGAAVAAAAVGAITGLVAINAGSDAETACPALRCSRAALDDVETGRTIGTVSTIAFVVAGASAAIGIYGLLRSPAAPPRRVGLPAALLRGAF